MGKTNFSNYFKIFVSVFIFILLQAMPIRAYSIYENNIYPTYTNNYYFDILTDYNYTYNFNNLNNRNDLFTYDYNTFSPSIDFFNPYNPYWSPFNINNYFQDYLYFPFSYFSPGYSPLFLTGLLSLPYLTFDWLFPNQVPPIVKTNPTNDENEDNEISIPGWLTQLINQLKAQPVANPPAKIIRYTYKGETVYYLPPKCCDVPSVLYDAQGNSICSPDGGFTGHGDGQCPDFFSERTNETIIWEDNR